MAPGEELLGVLDGSIGNPRVAWLPYFAAVSLAGYTLVPLALSLVVNSPEGYRELIPFAVIWGAALLISLVLSRGNHSFSRFGGHHESGGRRLPPVLDGPHREDAHAPSAGDAHVGRKESWPSSGSPR